MSHRRAVVELYKRILRTANKWQSTEPSTTERDREYILSETRRLFREAKNVRIIDVSVLNLL
jgi:hypothetical protein